MRYEQLLTLVTFAAFAASSTGAAAGIGLCWHWCRSALTGLPPVQRASFLLGLRAAPAAIAVCACAVTILAFRRHEPASTIEIPGWILLAAASLGAVLALCGIWRFVFTCWRTQRLLRVVESGASRVTIPGVPLPTWELDTAFPLVALAGTWRPRLLIARRVLEALPEDELQVVVRHELAHAQRRDNVARLLLTVWPDVMTLAGRRLGLERAWDEAAEDAADDLATRGDAKARIRLAAALVRVAKMAAGHAAPGVPLLAFHSGESVERRVRRLVDDSPEPHGTPPFPVRLFSIALVFGAVLVLRTFDPILLHVHGAIEWLVNAGL